MAIDFRLREFFYPVSLLRLRRMFGRTPYFPPEIMKAYQEKRLSAIVRQAFLHVPYYRSLFAQRNLAPRDLRTREDLKRLPVVSKDTLRSRTEDFRAADAARYCPVPYWTGGTTGQPLKVLLDKNARILEFVRYWRHWSWAGYRLGDRFVELRSYFFLSRKGLEGTPAFPQRLLGRLMLNSALVGPATARQLGGALRRWRPKYLMGTASALRFFAYSFKEAAIDDIGLHAAFSIGEVLTPASRALIESVFHCRVLDSYGHMEGTVAVTECLQGGYHVNEDYGILEFENVRSLDGGKTALGRAVGTALYNLAMPLIRYDLGDEIELFPERRSCPCGRTFPLVKAIHGRKVDTIVTPDGRFLTAMFVVPDLTRGSRFVQFIQTTLDRLEVLVVPGEEWDDRQRRRLDHYVRLLAGDLIQVRIREVSEADLVRDASGKIRSVISQVKIPGCTDPSIGSR